MMQMALLVFIGGGLGSAARYLSIDIVSRYLGQTFPYGVLAVNILGCLLAGFMIEAYAVRFDISPEVRALLMTGFLGGFTTFSAFSVDIYRLMQTDMLFMAALYVALSVTLGILAVFGGVALARGVLS